MGSSSQAGTVAATRTRAILFVTLGAGFMSGLDLFVVNVAFDPIGASLGVGTGGGPSMADLSWILNIYAVVFAALLVPFGRLADRYGRKRIFVGGLALFVLASAACALSGDVWMLVVFRGLQAAGAAAMTPTSLSILMAALPPQKRLGGVRMWSAVGAIAAAVGPTVGGFLVQISWQWVFLINLPVGIALLWFAVRDVRDTPQDRDAPTPDLGGALILASAVGLFALALVKSPDWGWGSPLTLGVLAASIVLTLVFAWRSRRHVAPVIAPALLRVPTFLWANIAMIIFNVAFASNMLIVVLWMQQVWGWPAWLTGLAIGPGPAMVPITVAFTARFLPRATPARLASLGALLFGIGAVYVALFIGTEPNYWLGFFPGWIIGGIGVGFALPNLMAGAAHDLPPAQASTGSGVITMARQIGFVIGISMLFAIVGNVQGPAAAEPFLLALWVSVGVLALAVAAGFGMASTKKPAGAVASAAPLAAPGAGRPGAAATADEAPEPAAEGASS